MKTSILQLLNVQMDTHKKHLSTEKKLFFSTLSNRHRKATAALSQIAVEGKPFGVQVWELFYLGKKLKWEELGELMNNSQSQEF